MDNRPYPHGLIIGGTEEFWFDKGGWVPFGWWCVLDLMDDGSWACTYRTGPEDEAEEVLSLRGHGPTPAEAFEALVRVWTFTNGGQVSDLMRIKVPELRRWFREDGSVRPEREMVRPE